MPIERVTGGFTYGLFLFTDIEGSTRLWEAAPEGMRMALPCHDAIVRRAIEAHGGYVFSTGGDGFAAAFARPADASDAAREAQAALSAEAWPENAAIRVRMALHTGAVEEREGDYFGPAVNRAARLMALAHGGQVLCSSVTAELLAGAVLTDLGEHRLRDLSAAQRVFQLGAGRFPALRSLEAFPGNLPLQVSSFLGRAVELARVEKALHEARVVTLTGVGGVGKTRLALQVAAAVLPRFREGVWLVELAPVRDPDGVVGAFAAVFGVVPSAGESLAKSLVEFLRTKQLLVVVDNCEHLINGVVDLVELLERSCAGVVVLATSREGLALEGERVVPVPSLAAPAADDRLDTMEQNDAVRLFVERAASVDPEFALTDHNAAAVGQVCRRLDGLPLAIELAAARVSTMTPAELARRLERRFDTLAGGRRRAVQRHQTLRAAIDWSYELCSEGERRLLARMSVFAGGCTSAAAEAVCAGEPIEARDVFELLAGLVAKSLVVAQREGPETRYRLLETIREYGEERLAEHGETDVLPARHAEHYAELERLAYEELDGPGQIDAARRLAAENENLLAAMNHALDTDNADLGLCLLRHDPGLVQIGYALLLPAEPVLRLTAAPDHPWYRFALALAAFQAAGNGDLASAEALIDQAIAAAARPGFEADWRAEHYVALARGAVALAVGDPAGFAAHLEHAAEVARAAGWPDVVAGELGSAAVEWALAGDADRAAPLAAEGLALARRVGAPIQIAMNLNALALSLAERDPEHATALLRESRHLAESFGYENAADVTQAMLVSARLGDWGEVLDAAPSAIRHFHWNNNPSVLAAIVNVAARALAPANPDAATVLQGAARRIAASAARSLAVRPEGRQAPDQQSGRAGQAGLIAELRREATALLAYALGETRLRELRAEGEAMDTDHAVAFALASIEQARGGC